MPFTIVRQDITKMKVDVIVNAANTELRMGGGVCGAIFKAAGAGELQRACDELAPIRTGRAAITPGFRLPARYVIHAAGPVYSHWKKDQSEALLRSAYVESLKLAEEYQCESIAFPLISSGIYGYPKEEALQVATDAITDFLADHEMDVYLVVFDKLAFMVSEKLMGEVESYIDEHYVDTHYDERSQRLMEEEENFADAYALEAPAPKATSPKASAPKAASTKAPAPKAAAPIASAPKASAFLSKKQSLDDLIAEMDEPFSDTLFRLIDRKGKTDVEVYKKANIDRKLFSKIRSVKGYTPKKPTILALAIALELTLEETDDLLERAGYALSHASKFDVIVEYFIVNGKYNIFDINQVLFSYDQPLLGGV